MAILHLQCSSGAVQYIYTHGYMFLIHYFSRKDCCISGNRTSMAELGAQTIPVAPGS